MKRFKGALITALIVGALSPSPLRAQTTEAVSAADSESSQVTAAEVLALCRRLDQQQEELRQLRDQLGTVQGALHETQAAGNDSVPGFESSSVMQASADLPVPVSPAVFELQERMAALEKRFDTDADSSEPKAYEVGSDMRLFAFWRNGLVLESQNKDFKVRFGGRMDMDVTSFNNDPALLVPTRNGGIGPQPNSVDIRRARLRAEGTMYENFDWVAEFEFAQTLAPASPAVGQPVVATPTITNLNVTWTHLPELGNFCIGNQKEPIGFEHMESARWLDFNERSYLQDAVFGPFNNGFNPGFCVYNQWGDNKNGTWWLGAFGNNSDPFGYSINNDWAITGRLTWLPIYDEPSEGTYLWHLGVAASTRHPDDGQVRVRVRGDIRSGPPGVLNPIYADTGFMEADRQDLLAFETAVVNGPWSLQAECVGTWVEDAVQPITPTPTSRGTPFFEGGYIQLMYFLTGDHRAYDLNHGTFDRIIPLENAFLVKSCDGTCWGKGAWQVGARYNAIDLNDNGVNGGILNSCTFTINWWLNPNAHIQFNYDLTHRSQVQDVPPGFINSFGTRIGYNF